MNKNYNWNPEEYETNSVNQKKWGKEIISSINLNGNERVLDIGCGDGALTKEIAISVEKGEVLGIDSSIDMIKLAEKKYPNSTNHNLDFKCIDARFLKLEGKFDLIFSNEALHWIKDHDAFLKNITSFLTDKGKIVFRMGGQGAAEELINILDKVKSRPQFRKYFTSFEFPYGFYGVREYEQILQSNNLSKTKLLIHSKIMYHNGRNGLKSWIRTTWLPYTSLIPKEERESFIEIVADEYLNIKPLNNNGFAEVEMKLIEVRAIKKV